MGGSWSVKIAIKLVFNKPRGPIKAVKATATTTVGNTNGSVESDINSDLPGNLYRVKIYAPGSANTNVNKVERAACQVVNHNLLQKSLDSNKATRLLRSSWPSDARLLFKIASSG